MNRMTVEDLQRFLDNCPYDAEVMIALEDDTDVYVSSAMLITRWIDKDTTHSGVILKWSD